LTRDGVTRDLVIGIFGPTASGKSDVAAEVASRIPGDLISADAMQAYAGLPILTNQPAQATRLVAMWPLDHEGSVAEYARLAHQAIDEILGAGRTPVVVGGTGLYLRAALAELELPEAPGPGARERWQQIYDSDGAEAAHHHLERVDPAAAAAVHPNDRRRVVRALELAEAGSSLAPGRDRLWSAETRRPAVVFGLDVPKEELDRRIERRTHRMFESGVEDEVRRASGGTLSTTARKTIGLDEIVNLPRSEAVEALIARTRRYAAYQRKWMRRIPELVTIRADRDPSQVADEILEVARARQRLPARRAG
jgi:tRNA dimethylallyltransferase